MSVVLSVFFSEISAAAAATAAAAAAVVVVSPRFVQVHD